MLAAAGGSAKNGALRVAADLLEERSAELLGAQRRRPRAGPGRRGAAPSSSTGCALTEARIAAMADGLRQVAALPDPVGEVVEGWVRPNGLRVERVRVPLGVVGIIYENRPNVTSDAAGLCLKAGNATMLRGSSGALALQRRHRGVPARGAGQGGPARGRAWSSWRTPAARRRSSSCGSTASSTAWSPGAGTRSSPRCASTPPCPYVIDGDGNCHVYVDAAADLDMALAIVVNAKTQRPGVCNAAESLLVHEAVAGEFLPRAAPGPGRRRAASATTRARAILPAMARRHRGRLRHRVPGPDHVGGGGRRPRRRHRPHRPVRLGPLRGHRDQRPARRRALLPRGRRRRRASSTPRPASSTAPSSASAPRSASPPRSSTPGARWACAS